MAGAVINALRFELHETGAIEEERARAFAEESDSRAVLDRGRSVERAAHRRVERRRLDVEERHPRRDR